jgi:hypothetical protein
MPAFLCIVLSCAFRGLAIGRSPVQGALPICLKGFTISEQVRGPNLWKAQQRIYSEVMFRVKNVVCSMERVKNPYHNEFTWREWEFIVWNLDAFHCLLNAMDTEIRNVIKNALINLPSQFIYNYTDKNELSIGTTVFEPLGTHQP